MYKLHFMTRKKVNIGQPNYNEPDIVQELDEDSVFTGEPDVKQVAVPDITVEPIQHTAPKVPVIPKINVAAKKRIRIRPSQKKKLSVAVLCTNPLTRRFI